MINRKYYLIEIIFHKIHWMLKLKNKKYLAALIKIEMQSIDI